MVFKSQLASSAGKEHQNPPGRSKVARFEPQLEWRRINISSSRPYEKWFSYSSLEGRLGLPIYIDILFSSSFFPSFVGWLGVIWKLYC